MCITVIYPVSIFTNVTYNNSKRGFTVNDGDSITMYNNTAYNTGSGFSVYTTGNIIKNNLCYGSTIYITDTLNESNNSWNLGITDPEFATIDSTSPEFLRLASGSPCIDVGVDVGLPFISSASDLGAYEYDNTMDISLMSPKNSNKLSFSVVLDNVNKKLIFSYKQSVSSSPLYVTVYNQIGRCVKSFSMNNRYVWDCKTESGNALASGLYFAHITAGDFIHYSTKILIW